MIRKVLTENTVFEEGLEGDKGMSIEIFRENSILG